MPLILLNLRKPIRRVPIGSNFSSAKLKAIPQLLVSGDIEVQLAMYSSGGPIGLAATNCALFCRTCHGYVSLVKTCATPTYIHCQLANKFFLPNS